MFAVLCALQDFCAATCGRCAPQPSSGPAKPTAAPPAQPPAVESFAEMEPPAPASATSNLTKTGAVMPYHELLEALCRATECPAVLRCAATWMACSSSSSKVAFPQKDAGVAAQQHRSMCDAKLHLFVSRLRSRGGSPHPGERLAQRLCSTRPRGGPLP